MQDSGGQSTIVNSRLTSMKNLLELHVSARTFRERRLALEHELLS